MRGDVGIWGPWHALLVGAHLKSGAATATLEGGQLDRHGERDAAPAGTRLRVCLAASGGGHVRQLLDLERAWSRHDAFFVTEDTSLGRSIAEKHPAHFVPHFALGQMLHGAPLRVLLAATKSFFLTAWLAARERPDVVITTGAGTVFFFVMWARLFGTKVVLMETFARIDAPSRFGRLVAPLASIKIVQSARIRSKWPDAAVFDPLQVIEKPVCAKDPVLFVTVGATLPFNRLVSMVAELKAAGGIPEQVIIQTGAGGVTPPDVETHESMTFEEMQAQLRRADIVVCHAGTGSLITALREGCRVIAVPRQAERKEAYDDHQVEIAESFAARGLIEVAHGPCELVEALARARVRPRIHATTDHARLVDYLNDKLAEWAPGRSRFRRPLAAARRRLRSPEG
jgi:UDP-N-acetylglucosamine--N-acetylmuramyl-(pentapeptide) pyrophosphoryl-undecaprenol N-acetylglucosamine transferase